MGTTYIKRSPAQSPEAVSIEIANAQSVAIGEYAVRDTAGRLRAAADTINFVPLGFITGLSDRTSNAGTTTTGSDTGDTAASPPPQAIVNLQGGIYKALAVVGAASQADVGRPVYVTGGNTFTLSETTHLPAIGRVVRWISGTSCDVLVFPSSDMLAAGGLQKRSRLIGEVSTLALRSTAALTIFNGTMRGYGRITRVWARPTGFHAGHNTGSKAVYLGIASVALTGGSVTLPYTAIDASGDLATELAGSAVSAGNEFNDGDSFQLYRNSGGAAFTATQPVGFEVWGDITYYGSDV